MKLMTYNILNGGGEKRLPSILHLIKEQKPDFVAIQEANRFDKNNKLEKFAKTLELPYFDLAPSFQYDFHEASFSRFPFKKVEKLKLAQNAALIVTIDTPLGEIIICNAHPCPRLETERLTEIDRLIPFITKSKQAILMGDMNSLSVHDTYPKDMIAKLSDEHRKKYTYNNQLLTQVTSKIEKVGFVDTAYHLNKNQMGTAPTGVDLQEQYSVQYNAPQIRIDYIFASKSLAKKIKRYEVIKNETTAIASDHYPIVVELK